MIFLKSYIQILLFTIYFRLAVILTMKRVQHNQIGQKHHKLDHVPLPNIDEFGDGMLGLLPNDVLEHLLVKYLSPADKSNLKLASKTCETRVMTLNRFSCSVCSKTYKYRSNLQTHMRIRSHN